MTVTTRRTASTETIHHLWDAIVYARQQRQIASIERISSYMRRKHNISPEDLEKQLQCAMQDDLIEMKRSVGCKGSKAGIEQDSYRIPEKDVVKDGHDWYCFGCHKEGEVLYCSTCHRVYHEACLKEPPVKSEKLVCEVCKMIKSKDTLKMDRDDLNLLLGYACLRLKEKVLNNRELLKIAPTEEEKWRHNFLIYETMDLTIMEDKTQENVYKRLEEFLADAMTLVHNIVIYYGVHSSAADTARQTLRDCRYDLNEIRQCRDCYRMSNEKRDKFWFCQPCDPPHELVYAKQKGYPFWPAKVISVNNSVYDVRFFGGLHERSRSRKRSVSSDDDGSENEAEEENSSQDECPTSSSPKVPRFKDAPTPEDHNVVSSSCQESSPCAKVTVSTQTHKKLLASLLPPKPKPEEKEIPPCNCEEKYSKMFKEFKERLEAEQKEEKERSLRELAERLRLDFEEEKKRVIAAAIEKVQFEMNEARRISEDQLKNAHLMEMATAVERHKTEISEVKKKQWCYNCEAEAIYHCCWNTSYCSVDCQQVHWHKEHKRTCRRKR
ncbi:unnamed protein product [Larinioides sclopetarius]|uniref:Zinc finger MYND domain-containing protein 11 n=1 Tax=Larinioides sclopetarius TaxID=280406 RepID=A0AAV1Z6Q2_9ARAC